MWYNWIKWREEFRPMDIQFSEIEDEYKRGKAYFCGHDHEGRLVLMIKPARHWPDDSDLDKTLKLGYYLIEKATLYAMAIQQHQFVIIYDRSEVTRKNVDMKLFGMMKKLASSMQNYYPERAYKVLVLHSNFFYHTMFAMIKPFLHKNTKDKI
jgi:CRAL/TRIO domain